MTASGADGKTAARSGSLLSLAPRTPTRRTAKPAPNPMLAALARSPQPTTEKPLEAAAVEEKFIDEEAVAGEAMTKETAAEEAVAEESIAAPGPEEPLPEPPVAENAAQKEALADDPRQETAKGLVARLRRQFMGGLPEGRAEAEGASTESAEPKSDAAPRRSAIEELRLRLSEFRTEILVRAAGRGKPSR